MLSRQGSKGEQDPDGAGAEFLEVGDRGAVDGVDQWSAETWSDLGQGVDGLHDPGVGRVVERVDPVANLVHDVDLPLAGRHDDECTDR
jgi:hypothetical protein